LCCAKIELGFQVFNLSRAVFNATNDTITTTVPTVAPLKKACPDTPITRDMGPRQARLNKRKIREVLGYQDVHDWKGFYNPDEKDVKDQVTQDGGVPI
jgi:UDP-glucose 4-epimerase